MTDDEKGSKSRRWIGCPIEEQYRISDRKAGKMERKLAKAKDRSKYKKTDQEKYLKSLQKDKELKLSKQKWLEGRVLSIIPQGMVVDREGERVTCVLKGLLKKEKTLAKNLVAVGDIVLFEKTGEGEGIIGHVQPRKSVLSRADNLSRKKEQLIAVNIDQVIITSSVLSPPLKCAIIDRYIIAARKGGMQPLIVINKVDLFNRQDEESNLLEVEKQLYEEAVRAYSNAGIPLISVSTVDGRGIEDLKEAMRDKASVFSGQSGVGKSSLINTMTGLDLRVGEVVEKTRKGSHTTTTAHLLPLEFGGWCIDTPGIKSFGIWNLKREEIESFYPEIHSYGLMCKFSDCTHTNEDQCAVLDALEVGNLSFLRYDSYQALRESVSEEHVRR
jgi:ribosome biogenesis GTPase